MASIEVNARVQNKRAISTAWEADNPVLLAGEMILVDMGDGVVKKKFGDGVSTYSELPFDVGEKGEQGDAFTYDDFTDEQLALLKGADGLTTTITMNDTTYTVDDDGDIDLGDVVTITDPYGVGDGIYQTSGNDTSYLLSNTFGMANNYGSLTFSPTTTSDEGGISPWIVFGSSTLEAWHAIGASRGVTADDGLFIITWNDDGTSTTSPIATIADIATVEESFEIDLAATYTQIAGETTTAISTHNTSTTAHSDIRTLITGKQDTLTSTQLGYIADVPDKLDASAVSDWALASTKPSYTANDVGADVVGSAEQAMLDACAYADALVSAAPDAYAQIVMHNIDTTAHADIRALIPAVSDWAQADEKPTYTASEVGAAATTHYHSASNITSGTLGVARGGSGRSTLTSGYYLKGNGTSAVSLVSAATLKTELGLDLDVDVVEADTDASWTGTVYAWKLGNVVTVMFDGIDSDADVDSADFDDRIATLPTGYCPISTVLFPVVGKESDENVDTILIGISTTGVISAGASDNNVIAAGSDLYGVMSFVSDYDF